MLTALDRHQNRYCLLERDEIAIEGPFYCPGCRGEVRLRQGAIVRPHFAHKTIASCFFQQENESAEHLELKGALYHWSKADGPVQLEAHLPDLGQVADLLLGDKLALEVQCSPLSRQRLMERTKAYQDQGYQVIWLLGQKLWLGSRLTALQKQLLYFSQNLGFYVWELDWAAKELRLKYLIHEDLRGKIQYLVRSFQFGQGCLLDCLRQPFARQKLARLVGQLEKDPSTYIAQQLYYRSPKWLKQQAIAYARGDNLLTKPREAFFPQLRPVAKSNFCQISQDLTAYYDHFEVYYQKQVDKSSQTVYSPIFYGKM